MEMGPSRPVTPYLVRLWFRSSPTVTHEQVHVPEISKVQSALRSLPPESAHSKVFASSLHERLGFEVNPHEAH